MKKAKIMIANRQKKVKVPVGLRLLVRKCCIAVLTMENFETCAVIDVSFVDNNEILFLNKKYRKKDSFTDVLSFPLIEGDVCDKDPKSGEFLLGDIVISLEQAVAQAARYVHSLQREVAYLTVHSVLHLIGYTHEESSIKKLRMREKEETIMARLGLASTCSYVVDEFLNTQ
ncbi:MAG: rRNA maturation RNase YbeY [Oscillospiraceae bacterium]|jgi:probable rRNA maturation factor|nr:rRNA maturation RNase YbeY [Oscillospiraceae bacterium]